MNPGPRGVLGSITSLVSGEILARLLSFAATAYLARTLGPAGFGIVGFAVAMVGYLSLPVNTGFGQIGAREVARRPQDAAALAFSASLVRLALAAVALAILGIVVVAIPKPDDVKIVLALSGLSLVSQAIDPSWVYKGLERNRVVGAALVFGQFVYVVLVYALVKSPHDVRAVPVAAFVAEGVPAVLLFLPLLRSGPGWPSLRDGSRILRASGFWITSRLFRTLIFTFDVILLGFLVGEAAVGLYTAPYRICFLVLAIAASVHVAYLPQMTRAASLGERPFADVAERALEFSAALAFPMVVGGMITARPLLETFFGADYVAGAPAFRFLLLSVGLIFLHGVLGNVLLVVNRTKTLMWITAAASAANVVLNLVLIPRYGLVGAAIVTATAEAAIFVLLLIDLRRSGSVVRSGVVLWSLIPSGVMAMVLFALEGRIGLLSTLLTGAIVYGGTALLTGTLPRDLQSPLRSLGQQMGDLWR